MKSCLNCGTEAPDDAPACAQCGRTFTYRGAAVPASAPRPEARPDGRSMKTAGVTCAVVGVILWLVSGTLDYAGDTVEPSTRIGMAGLGGLAVQFGLMAWLVGCIIHALSFLKGRDD